MKNFRIIPFVMLPLFIVSVILLRTGQLLAWQIDFNIIHNLCGINGTLDVSNHFTFTSTPVFIVSLMMILLTILLGPFFCGYLCPFGTYQRIIRLIGKSFKIRIKIPHRVHTIISTLKYGILMLFIYTVIKNEVMSYIAVDPYHGFIRLFYGGITLTAMVTLSIVTILSLFIERPFCNYLCPYGAGLNLIGHFRVLKITRTDQCIHCNQCNRVCPVQIDISHNDAVKNINCISCNACISNCPVDGALKHKKYHHYLLVFFIAVLLLGYFYFIKPSEEKDNFFDDPTTVIVDEADLNTLKDEFNEAIEEEKSVDTKVYKNTDTSLIQETTSNNWDNYYTQKDAEALTIYLEEQARLEAARLQAEKERLEAEKIAQEEARKKQEEEDKQAEETAAQEASSNTLYSDGIYKATVTGYRSGLVVQIEIKNDVIQSIEVLEHHETKSYFNFAAPKMISRILETNSINVDVVSRATRTSQGIKNGVQACLNKAKK
ncbi:MAG: 4Fe-4S binding protein [Clostridia bacterium]|nr:4Fe-4S binding protein [Clostridia bacterium]